jgi:hypothetical protein
MLELSFLEVLQIPEVDFIIIMNATEECIASCNFFFILSRVRLSLLVLRPLLDYCTSPR